MITSPFMVSKSAFRKVMLCKRGRVSPAAVAAAAAVADVSVAVAALELDALELAFFFCRFLATGFAFAPLPRNALATLPRHTLNLNMVACK